MQLNLVFNFLLFHIFVLYSCLRFDRLLQEMDNFLGVLVSNFYWEDCINRDVFFFIPAFVSVNVLLELRKNTDRSH